jgi:UDP-glucose 4-epimerase
LRVDDTAAALGGRTVLLTGAAGFIASAIARQLATIPCTVRCLARGPLPAPPAGAATFESVAGDIRDPEVWTHALRGVGVVFHLAGQTSVYAAQEDPAGDLATNVLPMLHLARAARTLGVRPTVIAATTATIVGLTASADPVDESRPDRPVTLYDLHKHMAAQYLETFTRDGTIAAATLRLTNVYGPGPRSSRHDRGILNAMVRRALSGEALSVYGAGAAVRDYVYVDDVARAFVAAAAGIARTEGRHFLVGSGRGTSIREAFELVADRVARRTGHRVPVIAVEPPAGLSAIEGRSFVADTRAFRGATGWHAEVPLGEGIDRTIEALAPSAGAAAAGAR